MKRIVIIIGTRPEAIKLIPVYREFQKTGKHEVLLISTGQHHEMLDDTFKFFRVEPHYKLEIMKQNQTLDSLSSALLSTCSELFRSLTPDLVMVQGDTTSSMSAALAAFYQQIPVAHIEAGLRSFDSLAPYPEEVNRRVISLIAQYHFAPTKQAASWIRREKVPGKIYTVGNTVIDSLLHVKRDVVLRRKYFDALYQDALDAYSQMVLITCHRRESFGEGFTAICQAIRELSVRYTDTSFIYPVHLNPNVKIPARDALADLPNVFLIDPVPYDHMVYLMIKSKLILTDSGGIQEEGPALGKPVLVMREKTERPEGIRAGCSVLAGTSKEKIVRHAKKIMDNPVVYRKMARASNPYGKGDSSKKICNALRTF